MSFRAQQDKLTVFLTRRRHRIFKVDFVDLRRTSPRLSATRTVARVQERVFERPADVLGSLPGHVVHDLAREEADVEGPLALALPVVVLGLPVDDDDGVTKSHFL